MMKQMRTIERIAYGDGTPDLLADVVPRWAENGMPSKGAWDWHARTRQYGKPNRMDFTTNSELEDRWLAACCVAHNAGCPPHWADMGFEPGLYGGDVLWAGDSLDYYPVGNMVQNFDSGYQRDFDSELEARLFVLEIINPPELDGVATRHETMAEALGWLAEHMETVTPNESEEP